MNCVIKFTYTFCNDINKQSALISLNYALSSQNACCKWRMHSWRGHAMIARERKDCEGTQYFCVPSQSFAFPRKVIAFPRKLFAFPRNLCVPSQSLRGHAINASAICNMHFDCSERNLIDIDALCLFISLQNV